MRGFEKVDDCWHIPWRVNADKDAKFAVWLSSLDGSPLVRWYLLVFANIEDNHLNKAFGIHEQAKSKAFIEGNFVVKRNKECSCNFACTSKNYDYCQDYPSVDSVDGRNISLEATNGEEQRQQKPRNKVFKPLNQC